MGRNRSAGRRLAADEAGSTLVEVALVLPVLLVLVAGVVMVGRVTHAQVAVQSVAREAARTVAVAPSEIDGLVAAQTRTHSVAAGHRLDPERLGVEIDAGGFERGGTVRVEASYTVSLADLPLFGALAVTVRSAHDERIETYRSRAVAP